MANGQTNTIIGLSAVMIFFGSVAWMVKNGFEKEKKNNRGGTRRKRARSIRK